MKIKTNVLGGVQGDVPILKIRELTEGGKPTSTRIVAYGEATGHHHEIFGKCEVLEVERNVDNKLFKGWEVIVGEAPVELRHKSNDEHYSIQMTKGIYFIPSDSQQVEYDGKNERRAFD